MANPNVNPPLASLSVLVSSSSSRFDTFLAHLNRCLATPAGIDTVLQFAGNIASVSALGLETASHLALRKYLQNVFRLLQNLPPNTTLVVPTVAPPAAKVALRLSSKLRVLAALFTEYRTFARLWGLLGMYFWAKKLFKSTFTKEDANKAATTSGSPSGSKSRAFDTALAWTQLLSCVLYQAFENKAYLGEKKVLTMKSTSIERANRWSVRFWAIYIFAELTRLLVERSRQLKPRRLPRLPNDGPTPLLSENEKNRDQDQSQAVEETKFVHWREAWSRDFLRNLAWAPLTISWSMEKGFAGEATATMLSAVAGSISMAALWRNSRGQ